MLTLLNRFSKYIVFILSLLLITLSSAQDEGAITITNIDGSSGQLLATDGNGQLYRLTLVPLSKAQASAITSTTAQTDITSDRDENISILDVDANGEVDALTDGLLLLRSMFELTDDALVTGVVDSANCKECDAEGIDQYISTVKESTFGKLSSYDDQNISGSSLDGTTLTIGIENGNSETVDLSSLEDGVGITSAQANAIAANTAKTGITSSQANAITANTAKTGITSGQASAITANTAKTGITSSQASAITANTAKTGITSAQANAITANSAKTVLALGTSSTTALAGNTPLLALGTTSTTALAGNTPTIPSGLSDDVVAIKSALKCIAQYSESELHNANVTACIRQYGLN